MQQSVHTFIVYEMIGNEKELFKLSSFIRGTVVLMAAVFLSKLLGFVYRMQFMRVAGEEAVGIYMTAYPAFIFFLSLVQLGVPIAIAKVIAELEAKGQSAKLPAVMRTATFITILTGMVFIPASVLFVPYLSETLLGNAASSLTLYVGIAIVPIAAIGGLIRGYFKGLPGLKKRPGRKFWSKSAESHSSPGCSPQFWSPIILQ